MATKTKAKLGNLYHQHRGRQRRRILDAAKVLFDERGIDRTTMGEFMVTSVLRASTLYEYFSKKDASFLLTSRGFHFRGRSIAFCRVKLRLRMTIALAAD